MRNAETPQRCGIFPTGGNGKARPTPLPRKKRSSGGTLIKGDMFGLGLMDEKNRRKLLAGFTAMGRYYAETRYFDKGAVSEFAAPERMSRGQIRMFNLFGRPLQRVFMGQMARKMGCRERLDARPYAGSCRP